MENLPPKTLKTQLVRLDNNLKQIERNRFSGIQRAPGSLPVLEAFQDFLDNERKKARRRLLALTAVFVILLLVTAAAGTGLVYWQMQRMAVDYDAVVTETEALDRKIATENEATRASLSTLETRFGTDRKSILDRHDKLASEHAAVAEQVTKGGESMATMQEVLDRLASENTALKEDLDRVMKDWPTVAQQVRELQELNTPAKRRRGAPEPSAKPLAELAAAVAAPVVKPAVEPPSLVALTIVPPGEALGLRWRLPVIPE